MARKNNLIELTLEVKRKGTEQIGKYKKELFELKKAANDLNKTLNATQKQLKQDVQNTSVKALGKDSEKAQAQIKKLEAALTKVTQELKDQKKAQSDLKKESNAKIQAVKSGAKAELKAYKDSQKALKKKKKEEDESNKVSKKSVSIIQGLGNAAATVNGPLNDLSGRINSLATGFKKYNAALIASVTAITAIILSLPRAIQGFSQMERQILRLQALTKQTNFSAGFTGVELENIAQDLAFDTLTSLTQARDAIGLLLTFPNIRGENFERVLELSQDIAEVTGRDLKSSTEQLSKALADPIKGITKLTEVGVVFTEQQASLIRRTQATSGAFAAQEVILDVLAGQYGGAANEAAQGFAGTLDTLGQVAENLFNTLGEAAVDNGFIEYLTNITKGLQVLFEAKSFTGLGQTPLQRLKQLTEGSFELNQALNNISKGLSNFQKVYGNQTQVNVFDEEGTSEVLKDLENLKKPYDEAIEKIAELKNANKEVSQDLKDELQQRTSELAQFLVDTAKQTSELINLETSFEGGQLAEGSLGDSPAAIDDLVESFKEVGIEIENIQFVQEGKLRNAIEVLKENISDLKEANVDPISGERGTTGNTFVSEEDELTTEQVNKLIQQNSVIRSMLQKSVIDRRQDIIQAQDEISSLGFEITPEGQRARIESKKQADLEVVESEEAKNKALERLREENKEELNRIELRKAQDEIDVKQELVNRQLRQDTDNVTLKNQKLSLQFEKEEISLKIRKLEIEKKLRKANQEATDIRKQNSGLTDSEIEEATADTDKPFTKTLGVIERTNKELDNVNNKINKLNDSLSEEQAYNIEINTKRINEQINTFIEDNNIKQKELSARLQGDTEESLENQLSVIDDKYDKALKNLEERIGKIPDNVLKEAADSKALEKANTTFDNVNKRFKNLTEEFKDGKVSVDSYIASVNELNKTLRETGDNVNIDIKENDALQGLQEGIKPRTDEAADDIQKILDKVEDADLSEGFELRKSALDRLREYSQELIRIKELNPEIDISDAVAQIKDLEKEIQNTYTLTEQIFRKMADDFASTFSDEFTKMVTEGGVSFRDMLKKSIAEAFGNYAVDRLRDMVFNGIRSGLESLGSNAISDFFTELDFGGFFSGEEDKSVIEYNKLEDSFEKSLKANNKNKQNVVVTNSEDLKPVKEVSDSGGDAISEIGGALMGLLGGGGATQSIAKEMGEKAASGDDSGFGDGLEGSGNDSGLGDKIDGVTDAVKDSGKNVSDLFKDIVGKGGGAAGAAGAAGSSASEGGGFLQGIMDFFKNLWENIMNLIPGLGQIGEMFSGLLSSFGGLSGIFENTLGQLGGIGDLFSSLISSFGGIGTFFSSLLSGIGGLAGGFFHEGGMVGSGGSSVMMSPSLLKNAKYFHDGGYTGSNLKNDEMAAILQKGEYVIDRKTTSDLLKKGPSGGSGNQVNITNNFGPDELAQSLSGNRISQDNIVNDIKARTSEIKNYLDR